MRVRTVLHFEKTSIIDASPETVWRFHERSDILQILTPPWQPVQIVRREGGLGVGAISEFRLWIGVIPVQWIAVHTACERDRYFVDEQKTGPMAFWQHRHQFEAQGDRTRLTDAIDYALPGGQPLEQLLQWWVDARLADMFDYRHRVTRQNCEAMRDDG
ncbi:SRPBCC family protein [Altericista sp. CCNU0014]|uniref:SRPBCC family protein n=1 Tax=Altericista sp. CCNU0014 TaxID=3082949 RepID=UPI00384CBD1E